MDAEYRQRTEAAIARMRKDLKDPWRLIRNAQAGRDPIIAEAETRQLEAMIQEFEAALADAPPKG
jgi:hypothetical protein